MDSERRIRQIEKKLGVGRTQISININPGGRTEHHFPNPCLKCELLHEAVGIRPCQPKPCADCGHFCGI